MSEHVKLIRPYISFNEISSDLEHIFDSGQLTKGINVEKFIASLVDYTNVQHSFLTTSATTALTMSLKAVGISPGDAVAISDFSFPATANVVEDLGATPIFIDVDKHSYNMTADNLRAKLNDTVKAVVFVDALGNPSGLLEIKKVCQEFEIPLIEDAACAIGSAIENVKIGNIADLTCFSFHPRKLLTTGEGGAILTNNPEHASWLNIKLNHGASSSKGKPLDFIDYGYNYRMSEIQALLGWKQMLKLDGIIEHRNAIANQYDMALSALGFKRQSADKNVVHNIQSLVFTVPLGVSRDALIDSLSEQRIESTIGTYCLSKTSYYCSKYNDEQEVSAWLEQNTITLPCYEGVDVARVTTAIENSLK